MTSAEALLEAVKAGHLPQVRRLLAADSELAALRMPSGETPVMAALYRGHLPVVEALIEAGAPLDVFASAALGRMEAIERILRDSPEAVNAFAYDGWTPLHLAAFFGQRAASVRLLQAGAKVAAESRNGMRNTPLHAALAGNRPDIGLLLIEHVLPEAGDPGLEAVMVDITMLVRVGGRERTAAEYAVLLKRTGFELERIIPTAAGHSVLEAVAA